MADRGYTLIDFESPPEVWVDWDRAVRFMEYVRENFNRIVKSVPARCEADLFAGGHAHKLGHVPLLGLWAPPALLEQVPPTFQMIDEISAWCASLSTAEVDAIIAQTTAPTWEELIRIRVYPHREHDGIST